MREAMRFYVELALAGPVKVLIGGNRYDHYQVNYALAAATPCYEQVLRVDPADLAPFRTANAAEIHDAVINLFHKWDNTRRRITSGRTASRWQPPPMATRSRSRMMMSSAPLPSMPPRP